MRAAPALPITGSLSAAPSPKPPITRLEGLDRSDPAIFGAKDPRVSRKTLSNYTKLVQVHVNQGVYLEKFSVHESLITTRFVFFKKALAGGWIDSKERIVRLPEDKPSIFHIYVHFLYTNDIVVLADAASADRTNEAPENLRLAELYVLAEKLQDSETKDRVLQAVIVAFQPGAGLISRIRLPAQPFVQTVYESTPSESLARKLIVHMYSRRVRSYWFNLDKGSNMKAWPNDFKDELLIAIMDSR